VQNARGADADEGISVGEVLMAPNRALATRSSSRSSNSGTSSIGPPKSVDPLSVYKLYRGATGCVSGEAHRVWVDFSTVQLCWARYDVPARPGDCLPLLEVSHSNCRDTKGSWPLLHYLDVYKLETMNSKAPEALALYRGSCAEQGQLALQVESSSHALQDFGHALDRLLRSHEEERRTVLEFIQRRLFQYLWVRQGCLRSPVELREAQAVLAFNLNPREGIAYLRGHLGKSSDNEVGEWLAYMSTRKGGIDPTLLGNYFSRRDALEVTRTFISRLNFKGLDIVAALRRLFDTFKPGGESQVITRILEFFAETYLRQWKFGTDVTPAVAYNDEDTVLQVSVSLIMLNTDLHIPMKKQIRASSTIRCGFTAPMSRKRSRTHTCMTVEEYVNNVRRLVSFTEVPDDALHKWYANVKEQAISVEPMPRVHFSTLPVQPDIEGWLMEVIGARVRRRVWAVLALQRLYLFSDRADEVDPSITHDLKDAVVCSVARDAGAKDRFRSNFGHAGCLCVRHDCAGDVDDLITRAFELRLPRRIARPLSSSKQTPQDVLFLVAETTDLVNKWVGLITMGPG